MQSFAKQTSGSQPLVFKTHCTACFPPIPVLQAADYPDKVCLANQKHRDSWKISNNVCCILMNSYVVLPLCFQPHPKVHGNNYLVKERR